MSCMLCPFNTLKCVHLERAMLDLYRPMNSSDHALPLAFTYANLWQSLWSEELTTTTDNNTTEMTILQKKRKNASVLLEKAREIPAKVRKQLAKYRGNKGESTPNNAENGLRVTETTLE